MAGHSLVMLGWSWTDLGVLCSQLFGQASAESCDKSVQLWVKLMETFYSSHFSLYRDFHSTKFTRLGEQPSVIEI